MVAGINCRYNILEKHLTLIDIDNVIRSYISMITIGSDVNTKLL